MRTTIRGNPIRRLGPCGSTLGGSGGFALTEQLMVIMIAAVGLSLVVPSLGQYMAKQQLNSAVSTFSVFVQEAREAALTTGCDVELLASPASGNLKVDVRVKRNADVLACSRWFEFNGVQLAPGTTIQSGLIGKVTTPSSAQLVFEGFSGQLSPVSLRTLSLSRQSVRALVAVPALGSPTVTYAH